MSRPTLLPTAPWLAGTVAAVLLAACAGQRVAVPPRIDLHEFQVIGLARFDCNEQGGLDEYVTQRFLEYVLSEQVGVRIIELPSRQELLEQVGHAEMGPDALRAIGERHRVATLLTGTLTVDEVKPKVNLATIFTSLNVRADVSARMSARMLDTGSGATMWTASSEAEKTVGEVQAFGDGTVLFDAEDPDRAYGDLVEAMVDVVTVDFRTTWVRMKK
jgi:hypothetical protein